jgi:hypothetical protein
MKEDLSDGEVIRGKFSLKNTGFLPMKYAVYPID